METRPMGKLLAFAWTAAFAVCSVGIAGEADSESDAKPDVTAAMEGTQIECKARKRTAESWHVVNRGRIDQEVAKHNLANGAQDNSLGPPQFLTETKEAAEARNVARVLTKVCAMKAVDAEDSKAMPEQKSPATRRAGPR